MNKIFKNKSILITGGTGSFGKKCVKILLQKFKPKKIIIFSRDELKQYEMQLQKTYNSKKVRYLIGDVRELERLKLAMQNVDIVIHAAALKHVPTSEYNPFEVVKTNVIGAQNVIEASYHNNVEKVIALSTDKAASPINLYGATKLTSDKLFVAANNYRGKHKTRFSVVRYGNVMNSRGSVLPLFIHQAQNNGFFTITNENMTRFNISLNEGVEFVIKSLKKMLGGEIFIPKIPSFKIVDLAYAVNPKLKKKTIGVRPGEKIHEEMITASDSVNTIEFNDYFIICPQFGFHDWKLKTYIFKNKEKNFKRVKDGFIYDSKSNKHFLSKKEIKKVIKKIIND
tara:strand:+ start:338 stop:1357 length:1020 start_codon:yes stop_codon:yes gene_type:complete